MRRARDSTLYVDEVENFVKSTKLYITNDIVIFGLENEIRRSFDRLKQSFKDNLMIAFERTLHYPIKMKYGSRKMIP